MRQYLIPLALITLGTTVAEYTQPSAEDDGMNFALSILPGTLVDWRVLAYPYPFKAHVGITKITNKSVQYPNYHITFAVQSRPICVTTERECGASNMSRRPVVHLCRALLSFGVGLPYQNVAALNSLQLSCSAPIVQ